MASHAFSTNVLQNLDGQVHASRVRQGPNAEVDQETQERICNARHSHPELMTALVNERKLLRESLLVMGTVGINMPYGRDYLLTGMSTAMATLKDIFVARVALHFMEHLGLERNAALNEAAAVAWTDGLFNSDVAKFDGQRLYIDLKHTITTQVQEACEYALPLPHIGPF
ncbi:hypothetical protein CTheo_9142 [Ceratobasidium theobromae]|uniref:Uncharacterized protein n=1 Tax=Ceratobasidium theobromae TaxID=1582974 RepID=A0A5N5Q641_9AGAM|nr:hypothetical protein CTheo_9142 [Ceratobasidium theobromae]